MARAVKKILTPMGILFPNIARIAREKAMSVAMGIPHPADVGEL